MDYINVQILQSIRRDDLLNFNLLFDKVTNYRIFIEESSIVILQKGCPTVLPALIAKTNISNYILSTRETDLGKTNSHTPLSGLYLLINDWTTKNVPTDTIIAFCKHYYLIYYKSNKYDVVVILLKVIKDFGVKLDFIPSHIISNVLAKSIYSHEVNLFETIIDFNIDNINSFYAFYYAFAFKYSVVIKCLIANGYIDKISINCVYPVNHAKLIIDNVLQVDYISINDYTNIINKISNDDDLIEYANTIALKNNKIKLLNSEIDVCTQIVDYQYINQNKIKLL